jgi:hypothetical protein
LEYYDFPGIIGERFRRLFDPEDKGCITKSSYIQVMKEACLGDLKCKLNIVFQMLDFDNDGYVSKDDVSSLLLHIPHYKNNEENSSSTTLDRSAQEIILARQKSKDELSEMLWDCYKDDFFTFQQFEEITTTKASDIFVTLFYILLTKFPTLSELQMSSYSENKSTTSNQISIKKSHLPPARRMPNLWPIKEIYSKKGMKVNLEENINCKKTYNNSDEENVEEDECEENAKLVISSTFNSNDIKKKESMTTSQKTHREGAIGFLQFNVNVIRSNSLKSNKDNSVSSELALKSDKSKKSAFGLPREAVEMIPHNAITCNKMIVDNFEFNKSDTIMECLEKNTLIEGNLFELVKANLEPFYYILKGKTLYSNKLIREK